jgi:glycosyltransferase involved in cell wall biosynthesis
MNILLVAEVSCARVICGAERVLREQALGLASRGHIVRVLTRMDLEGGPASVEFDRVAEIRYAVDRRNAVCFFLSSLENAKRAWRSHFHRHPPDMIVVHQSLPGLALRRAFSSVPMTYVCLSLAHEEFESRNKAPAGLTGRFLYRLGSLARQWTEHIVIRKARRIIVLSDFIRRRVIECHGIKADHIDVIPGGVDPKIFSPALDRRALRSALGLTDEEFVLFTVRNLVPRMGLAEFIRAVARLHGKIPRLRLLIGGSGPLRSELETQVKVLGLEGCIRFLGYVPEALLPDYYRAADLFVLPTAELEGFGLVTVEALASGTPVFGTPVGATEEILGKLDHSLLAAGTGDESLAEGIAALYRRFQADPALRDRLSTEGRALVLRDYTWARHCEQFERVLFEVLATVHKPVGNA